MDTDEGITGYGSAPGRSSGAMDSRIHTRFPRWIRQSIAGLGQRGCDGFGNSPPGGGSTEATARSRGGTGVLGWRDGRAWAARYVHYVFANPVNGRQSPRSRLTAIALVVVGAVVLSTATVLGLRWATASSRKVPAMNQVQQTGFTKLDRQAPAVLLPSLRGSGTVSVAKLAGRPIVLNFWASTCEVCKSETPALASMARTLGGKVTFVGIDSVDRHGPAMAFIAKYHVPYSIGFDPQGTAAIRYGVVALPVTFFLSASGKTIMGENIGALTRGSLRTILLNLYGAT